MQAALAQARLARDVGEVPVGAVLVVDGERVNIPALPAHQGTPSGVGVGLLDCLRAFKIPISADEQPRKPHGKPY